MYLKLSDGWMAGWMDEWGGETDVGAEGGMS